MSEGRPKVAIIGCGPAAAPYVAALRELAIRPAVFIDADEEAALQAARGRSAAAMPDVEVERFDAAIVTGRGRGREAHMRALVAAGKPMLCAPEAAFADVGDSAGSFSGSPWRFAAAAQTVFALLQQGRLGSILAVEVHFGEAPTNAAGSAAFWDPSAGAGVLVDPGMHVIDVLTWWLGPLEAQDLSDDKAGGLEAEALARLRLANGAMAVVELSRLRRLRNTAVVIGARGRLEIDLDRMQVSADPASLLGAQHGEGHAATRDDLLRKCVAAWLATVRGGAVHEALAPARASAVVAELYARRRRVRHAWETTMAQPQDRPVGGDVSAIAGLRVLVTGGTGFIGARLAEKLAEAGAQVTVAVRNMRRGARIARLGVAMQQADLRDARDAQRVTASQQIVFSLAYDFKRSGAANLAMHRAIADACAQQGVDRFVHLSSIAVYDDWPEADLTESSPKDGPGGEYKEAKRKMEIDLAERAAAGVLACVILQPTIVYGPFSAFWTDALVQRLRDGTVVLPRRGLGWCNGVHVDDVVDALISAATRRITPGECYIISGRSPFEWGELIAGYAEAIGAALVYEDAPAAVGVGRAGSWTSRFAQAGRPALRALLARLRDTLGDERVEAVRDALLRLRRRAGAPIYRPADENPRLYGSKAACSIAKAARELGYSPAFTLDAGLRQTRAYVGWRYRQAPFGTEGP